MLAGQVWTQDFTIGNLKYTITDFENHKVSVGKADTNPTGELVIEPTVEDDGITYTVTSIREQAFVDCWKITSVIIPNSVVSIGASAFKGCSMLESMTLPFVGTKKYSASYLYNQFPLGYLFGIVNYSGSVATTQTYYGGNSNSLTSTTYYIPSSLKYVTITDCNHIAYGTFFNCNNLISVLIPSSVTSIGASAFNGCSKLTTITIPNSVTSIGAGAFLNCPSLSVINIESGNNNYVSVDGVLFNADKTTLMCYPASKSDTSYIVPNTVTYISGGAFKNSANLKSVIVPNSVTNIGDGAFNGCSSLESMTLPFASGSQFELNDNYQSPIGWIFGTDSYLDGEKTEQNRVAAYEIGGTVKGEYYIPKSLKSVTITGSIISKYAFMNCKNITSIIISESVATIAPSAFMNCSSLTSIVIPNTVTYIGAGAFNGCASLESMRLPFAGNTPEDQDYYCFGYIFGTSSYARGILINQQYHDNSLHQTKSTAYCIPKALKTVTITGDYKIPQYAFENCIGLESVRIIELQEIGDYAFYKCTGLTSMTIPNLLVGIGQNAFEGCTGLTSVVIPETVANIGNDAFKECGNNTTLYCQVNNKQSSWGYYWNRSGVTVKWGCKVIRPAANNDSGCVNIEGANYAVKGDDGSLWYLNATTDGSATLIATAEEGYHFIKWNDNNTDNPRTINVTENQTYTATFGAHIEETDAAVPATCTKTGLTEGSHCSVCNTVLVAQTVTPMAEHTVVTDGAVPATCTKAGLTEGSHCSVCGTVLVAQTETPMAAHTVAIDAAVAATCTTKGKTEGSHCSVCEAVLVAQTETPMAVHTIVADAAVAATATTDGLTEGSHCSVCGKVIVAQTVIPALGEQGNGNENQNGNEENQGGNGQEGGNGNQENGNGSENQGGANEGGNENQESNNEGGNENQGGENQGNETLVNTGYNNGYKAGYSNGYADGLADARGGTGNSVEQKGDAAYNEGYYEGYKDGYKEGYNNGKTQTDVSQSAANAVNIYAHGNTIVVENATDEIRIYNAMGALVGRDVARNVSTIKINNSDVYIVKTGNTVKRVVVN